MEIARLEVSTQQHLERMQETAKVNYVQYGKSTKGKKGKNHSLVQGQVATGLQTQWKRHKVSISTGTLLETKYTGLQSCGCNMQRMWKERTL